MPNFERYQRQMLMQGFGLVAQQQLAAARVAVIGAGGLSCPALQYLVAAGVGHILIIDDDVVELSNLHRQVLYQTSDVGKTKVSCAARTLIAQNPEVQISTYEGRITAQNALELLADWEVILDGSDNFATRYLVNDACVLLGKPLVFGAVSRFEGQLSVFNLLMPDGTFSPNYRDLFPIPPAAGEVQSCVEGGVLGILPGIIGTLQASEVIKILTGIGTPKSGAILCFNALQNSFFDLKISSQKGSRAFIPDDAEAFRQANYDLLCSVS